jgi:hypothetical protein
MSCSPNVSPSQLDLKMGSFSTLAFFDLGCRAAATNSDECMQHTMVQCSAESSVSARLEKTRGKRLVQSHVSEGSLTQV